MTTIREIEEARTKLAQMKQELLTGCMNMKLNVCDACQSKKECCEIAFNEYQNMR